MKEIIARDRVKWAISSFEPFKSPGPDDIFPALLQNAGDILYEYLVDMYKNCLRWCNTPDCWNDVLVVFIAKAGKPSPDGPKDFRPISVSCILLKALERLIDLYLMS